MRGRNTSVTFWGTRGSIPSPGPATVLYGGNTSCVEVRHGEDSLILDGGSGIRLLGLTYSDNHFGRLSEIPVLVSHNHMDHIIGLPFFGPILQINRKIRIYGPPGLRHSLKNLFPFHILPAQKRVIEIEEKKLRIGPYQIESRWLNHPGLALGYRIVTPDHKIIIYVSDHESPSRSCHNRCGISDKELSRWAHNADLLIMDAQYFEKEYRVKQGWGHSPSSYTVHTALKADVKQLALYHHDPLHSDHLLKKKEREAIQLIRRSKQKLACFAASEGTTLTL
ncbi:MAG: MBL fold metallo-hydrolase [Deltaproteobacteria bacterium]|nr:MBL fold metallo-hydrolase [Deltaproteobacteria bacterium]